MNMIELSLKWAENSPLTFENGCETPRQIQGVGRSRLRPGLGHLRAPCEGGCRLYVTVGLPGRFVRAAVGCTKSTSAGADR
jgi:hypothetical protein